MKWASSSPSGGEVEGRACEGVRSLAGVDSGDCGRDCECHGFFFAASKSRLLSAAFVSRGCC